MKKYFLRKLSYVIISIFWIITMVMLIMKYYLPEKSNQIIYETALQDNINIDKWMGVYVNGDKVGYFHRKIEDLESGYKIFEKFKVRFKMMGKDKVIETDMSANTDKLLRLQSFKFNLWSDMDVEVNGKVKGQRLFLLVNTNGLISKQIINLKQLPYMNFSLLPYVMKSRLKIGSKITIPIFDPFEMDQGYIRMDVVGEDLIILMGEKHAVYKLEGNYKGIKTLLWVNKKGEVLKVDSPLGFSLVKEDKENALSLSKPSFDIVAQASIPFNLSLPSEIKYLKVRLSGVELKDLELDSGRQKLKGDILEIHKESISSISMKHIQKDKEKMGEYLKSTIFIQSNNPEVVSLSRKIAGKERDLFKIAKRVNEWVYKNIEKVPTITVPLAVDVLRRKQGDCNEHTVLFTSLARALGIPTRIVFGVVYREGYFYYHAWPEIYFNEWIAVDPTFGQFPADATHIRLLTGDFDRQFRLARIINKIRLEGIEYN